MVMLLFGGNQRKRRFHGRMSKGMASVGMKLQKDIGFT
jgi:hypothetical protein